MFVIAAFTVIGVAHQTEIEVHSKTDLQTVTCGWPLKFIENDQSWRDPPFPWKIDCLSGEWSGSLKVLWLPLALNIAMFYFSLVLLWGVYRKLVKRKLS